MASSGQTEVKVTEYKLSKEQELRLEVDFGATIKLKIIEGLAEIFGAALAPKVEYTFTAYKFSVFTWHGCIVQITGPLQHSYVADETPMLSYLNLHLALLKLRQEAQNQNKPGPRAMIIGPTDVGKSTLSRILLNYCVRAHQQALFVDLDVGQGSVSLPGSICAVPLERVIDVEQHFESTTPLVYFYGHTSPGENPKLYNTMVSKLSNVVHQRLGSDPALNQLGFLVNTCGWVENVGYQTMVHAINAFKINIVIVLGDERLYSEVSNDTVISSAITFIKLAKSGGVVVRDGRYRRRTRNLKIREYFYGIRNDLAPHRIVVHFADVELYQVGQTHIAPSSALPIGQTRKVDETMVTRIEPSPDLVYAILGISFAEAATGTNLLEYNVAGFVYVDGVDMNLKKLSLLSPSAGKLPRKLLLMGSLKWLE